MSLLSLSIVFLQCVLLLSSVSFCVVLLMFVCVVSLVCSDYVVSKSASDWLERFVSEATYNVLMWTLDPTDSLTHSLTHTLPQHVLPFGRCSLNGWCVITEIIQKSLTFRVPPFKVTQCHWNRHWTIDHIQYDFLLVFHSKYGLISYRFRDKWQYLYNFSTFVHLTPPLRGFPLDFCNGGRTKKIRMMRLPECRKCVTICQFI